MYILYCIYIISSTEIYNFIKAFKKFKQKQKVIKNTVNIYNMEQKYIKYNIGALL